MRWLLTTAVAALALVACAGSPGDPFEPTGDATTTSATVTSTSSTTPLLEPSSTIATTTSIQGPTTTASPALAVAQCPAPNPLPGDRAPWVVDLHSMVTEVATDTNHLGAALLEVSDFSPGWELREPIASPLGVLLADLDSMTVLSQSVFADEFGGAISSDGEWVWPEELVPVSPTHSLFEEFGRGPESFESGPLYQLFTYESQEEAVDFWNTSGSPCSFANHAVGQFNLLANSDLGSDGL